MLEAMLHRAREFLANHRTHRAAEETELEGAGDNVEPHQLPRHDDQRLVFARLLLRLDEPVLVALGVLELEWILRLNLGGKFDRGAGIQEFLQPLPSVDAHVVRAFRADMQVALDLGPVQHRIAGRTFGP